MNDPWADVPDIEIPRHLVRSKVPYPDPAPEMTAHMWEGLRAARAERQAVAEVDEEEYEPVVTQEAEEFDDLCSPLATMVDLAHKNGWEIVSLAHSVAFAKGAPFKSGANEGSARPDRTIENQWAHFQKDGKRVVVYYEVVNGEVRSTSTLRRCNGVRYSAADLNKIIKGTL